jgi:hypothetical protein
MFIFIILYDDFLLPAQFHYVIKNMQYLESHVQLMGCCALWKFTSGGTRSKFPGAVSISHYFSN